LRAHGLLGKPGHFDIVRKFGHVDQSFVTASRVEAMRDKLLHAEMAGGFCHLGAQFEVS
jgi:hypothetical protein